MKTNKLVTIMISILLLLPGCRKDSYDQTEMLAERVPEPINVSGSIVEQLPYPEATSKPQQPQSVSEQVIEMADSADSGSYATGEIETDNDGNHLFQIDDTGKFPLFPLYAMIPTENIYLYGVFPYGMILYQNGRGTYFDWLGPDRFVLPQMLYNDFNCDGKKELAVTIFMGHGTGIAVMDLHVLKIEDIKDNWDKPIYSDFLLSSNNVHEWLPITANLVDKNMLILDICGERYTFENERMHDLTFLDIIYGDLVYFSFEGSRIRTDIKIGALFEEYAIPWYFGTVEATVTFDGEGFSLEDRVYTTDVEPNTEN
jgi:hypothetical protein